MPEYRVTWEIDISADSPLEAARQARLYQVKPDTTAVVFTVGDETIDLLEWADCPSCGEPVNIVERAVWKCSACGGWNETDRT